MTASNFRCLYKCAKSLKNYLPAVALANSVETLLCSYLLKDPIFVEGSWAERLSRFMHY